MVFMKNILRTSMKWKWKNLPSVLFKFDSYFSAYLIQGYRGYCIGIKRKHDISGWGSITASESSWNECTSSELWRISIFWSSIWSFTVFAPIRQMFLYEETFWGMWQTMAAVLCPNVSIYPPQPPRSTNYTFGEKAIPRFGDWWSLFW